jgi:NarL family two-component system response regulator LiaR
MPSIVVTTHTANHPKSRPQATQGDIRVFAACGDTMFRRGVAAVLADYGGFEWVGEAQDHAQALSLAARVEPDVAVIDADLPGPGGLVTLQALRQSMPRSRFAVLLRHLDPDGVRSAVSSGASCVLGLGSTQEEVITALQAMHRGVWAHSPAVTQALTAPRTTPALNARLTPRERDLLTLMARGFTNGDIARQLSIAMPTVKFHVGHIMSKLGVENRTAAVLAALRHKLVDLEPQRGSSPVAAGPVGATNATNAAD